MKKLMLATLATLAIGTVAEAAPIKIGIGAEPYAPFTSPDASGNWVGWEIDIANAICKQAALDCVITPTAWDGIIPALTSGQIDLIINSMSITPERLKIVDFSDKYYNAPVMVIVAKDSTATPDAAGMTGKIIGIQVSTVHEAYVQKYFAPVAAEVKTYLTQDEEIQDLAAGRVDAVIADSVSLQTYLDTDAGKACCKAAGMVADDSEILGQGVGIAMRKGEPMKETLNDAIKAIRADGTYDAITRKYFSVDVYGE